MGMTIDKTRRQAKALAINNCIGLPVSAVTHSHDTVTIDGDVDVPCSTTAAIDNPGPAEHQITTGHAGLPAGQYQLATTCLISGLKVEV